jgi:hypothetical protein
MSKSSFAASIGAALAAMTFATAVAAQTLPAGGSFQCHRVRVASHTHPVSVYCEAKTPAGVAYLRPVDCNPAAMSEAAMRADCDATNAGVAQGASGQASTPHLVEPLALT